MPHIFELPANQATELASPGLAPIRAKVTLDASLLPVVTANADGSYVFGPTHQQANIDITSLVRNKYIAIRSAIPPLPTEDGRANQQGSVTIQIDNTARYFAAVQDEAILDPDKIQQSEVSIYATCGPMPELPLYKGKVIETPVEEEGKTTIRTRSVLWDLIDVPLALEVGDDDLDTITPKLFVDETIISTPTTEGGVKYYHGVGVFDQFGDVRTSVSNDSPQAVLLSRVDFQRNENDEAPYLGKFTITFLSPTEFEVTQPDGIVSRGNVDVDFNSGFLNILASYWTIDINEDATGAVIEFNTYYTAFGNPFTICKHLLYKSLTGEWGGAVSEPATLPVDWAAFAKLETAFPSWRIFFCETNDDNDVFSPNVSDKPKRIKDVLQKILDHVGCQLTYTPDGLISMKSSLYTIAPFTLYTYVGSNLSSGNERKASHSIQAGGPKFERLLIKYGLNPISGDYGSKKVQITPGTEDKFNTYEIALDYYKAVRSDRMVEAISTRLFQTAALSNRRLKMSMLPNYGLPMQPGDKFEVNMATQPVLPNTRTGEGRYWMAYDVRLKVGDVVEVMAVEIPEPFEPDLLCQGFVLCESRLC